ncbi:hypothetical protein [Pseudomonas putida]|uniref:hypothetical protein n=1 Tax=Pseudomonas putida TaxID=303 RepID=UPI0021685395|nr:hypothetical protein [Pseudomonas putida]MCS4065614.1 hypothetical protein [Pseudomonas putida]
MIKLWNTLFREGKYQQIVDDSFNRPLEGLGRADFNYLGLSALASKSHDWFDGITLTNLPEQLQPYYSLYYGATFYQRKDYVKASELINACKPAVKNDGYILDGTGCSWLRGVSSYTHQLDLSNPPALANPAIEFVTPASKLKNSPLCFLASADSNYFSKFGGGLINSFIEKRDNECLLFLAIINPTIEAIFWIEQNQARLSESGIHFLTTSGNDNKTYYACNRFLLIPQLLQQLGSGIFSIDIDAIFVSPTSTFTRRLLGLDGAFQQQEYRLPWQRCQAGRIYFANTDNGQIMAKTVADFCRWIYDESVDQWFLDQNALEYYRRTQEESGTSKLENLHKLRDVKSGIFCPPGSKKKQLESTLF